jgi:uncharacterized protein
MIKNNKRWKGLKPMKTGRIITADEDIRALLRSAKTIAVLGLSPKPDRDSFKIADYLKQTGYRILPIRPAQKEILGEKAFASLNDLNEKVDIVVVFRNPDQILEHAQEALLLKPTVFWMQLGITNHDAALLLNANGMDVVMNKCIKVEHERLIKISSL